LLAIAAALAVVAAFGPEAIRAQAIRMVPAEQAEELGDQMLLALMDRGGGLCSQPAGRRALDRIAARVTGNGVPPRVQVLALGAALSAALPGGMVLLDSAAVQGAEAPGAIAGWMAVALDRDPVAALMAGIGPLEDLRYVLTGEVGYGALAAAATDALAPPTQAEATAALDRLSARGIDPNAFTEAMHRAGLDTPYRDPAGPREPLLADQDWVALKGICG
jgi:hypothetical protein